MKVKIELSEEYQPPYAVIYTNCVTDEVRKAVAYLGAGAGDTPLIVQEEERLMVLRPEEIYMIRVEEGNCMLYTKQKQYPSRRRLYELTAQLGADFMQISKQTVVRLACIQSVEAGFSGTLFVKLKNGLSDYVSRKYLPDFKQYLGL